MSRHRGLRIVLLAVAALVVLALLAVERFAIEFLRAKDDRFFGELTLAQAISAAVLLVVAVLAWRWRGAARAAAAPAAVPPRASTTR
ncbi:MAG TPA: hypothetical protein VF121_11710 [Thermoanaerobaculia bacterium]|nr:hypothetical protein [Thermoanaerobaculia bacterium]